MHVFIMCSGSVLPRALIPCAISIVVCQLVLIEAGETDDSRSALGAQLSVFRNYLRHPYPHQITSVLIGFMMVFRVQLSYQRFWEGITVLTDMWTKWYDAAVQVCAFDEMARDPAAETGPGFRAHAMHLFSLMSACGLLEIKRETLRVFEAQYEPAPALRRARAQWRLARRILGVGPPEPDYAGKDAIEVLGGLEPCELKHLGRHTPDFVDCALARLVRSTVQCTATTGLTVLSVVLVL